MVVAVEGVVPRERKPLGRVPILAITGVVIGKTALVQEFLKRLSSGVVPIPGFVFAWSCYENNDARALFKSILGAFGDDRQLDLTMHQMMDLVANRLSSAGRVLIVLDGFESVRDPQLDDFFRMISHGQAQTIITSRTVFAGAAVLQLGGFTADAARDLLRRLGVSSSALQTIAASVPFSTLRDHPLALTVLAAQLAESNDEKRILNSIASALHHKPPLEEAFPIVFERIDQNLSNEERALLARLSLFRRGVSSYDIESLFARSSDPAVSGPLSRLRNDEIAALLRRLEAQGLTYKSEGLVHTHPIVREYFVKALSDSGPLHTRLGEHYFNLLGTEERFISHETAEIVLEVVYHLTRSRHVRPDDIKKLARLLPREKDPTMRAYSSLLDAALQLKPDANSERLSEASPALRAFLSYVREDRQVVARLRDEVENAGIGVWQDIDSLIPGKRWKEEIEQAIRSGDFFIACFSENSAKRARTHMREEILIAVEELRLRPVDRSWFIPVMLSASQIPDVSIGGGQTLRDLHWVDVHSDWESGIATLLRAFGSTRA